MAEPLPKAGRTALWALAGMAVLWCSVAGACILISRSEGWDAIRTWFSLHFGWAGVGCLAMTVLLWRGSPRTRTLMWFVLPFCIVLFPIGPALAIYAAYKLDRPEMKEYFNRKRQAASAPAQQSPPTP
ncbi:MAG TPA: hypothetical protein VM431_08845 [Phycisphaerae bacterium]|nr:hypothetical protein [Phycisphaerae bacterium]